MTDHCLPSNILEQLKGAFAQYPDLKAVKLFGLMPLAAHIPVGH